MTDHPSTWGQWWALVWELPQAYSQGSEFWYLVTGGVDPTTGAALETGVRPALARLAIRAFFELLWWINVKGWTMLTPPKILKLKGRSRLLDGGGDAQEAAWLDISTPAPCNDDESVPLVSSRGRLDRRYYVHHKQWVSRQRGPLARNLAAFDARVDPVQLESYIEEIGEKSLRVMMSQAVRPAEPPGSELPVWGVEFTNAQEAPPAPPPLVEGWTGASLPWELGG